MIVRCGVRSPLLRGCGAFVLFACFLLAVARCGADPVIEAATGMRGVCVHLGAGDGQRTVAIAKAGEAVVHVLATDADAAAASVRAAGLDGRVSVEQWSLPRLPYGDRFADLVVAEADCGVSEKEIRRVLTPNGKALIAKGSGWRTVQGEPAPGADNWTHIRHGADGNPISRDESLEGVTKAPPDRLRWINDVTVIWPHALRIVGDRAFLFRMNLKRDSTNEPQRKVSFAHVKCRNAWNGTLIWEDYFQDVGSTMAPKRPVVTPERLYLFDTIVLSLDAATGREIARSSPLRPFEILVPGDGKENVVVARTSNTVVGLDAATLEEKWRVDTTLPETAAGARSRGPPRAWSVATIVSDGKRAYTIEQVGTNLSVQAIAVRDGAAKPIGRGLDLGLEAYPMLVSDGVLVVAGKGYAAGIPTDGKGAPWKLAIATVEKDKQGKAVRSSVDVPAHAMTCGVAQGGRLWLRDGLKMVFGDADARDAAPEKVGWTGIDLRSGAPVARIGYPTSRPWGGIDLPEGALGQYVTKMANPAGRNWSHRCYPDIAFPRAILSQTTEIVGFDGEEPLHLRGVRGQCGIGYALGAGGMFTPPNQCIGCYPMVRGMIAYEPRTQTGAVPVEDDARLVRGPAFGSAGARGDDGDGWWMYRRDARRTGCSPEAVATEGLTEIWAAPTSGRCTQIVVRDGIAVVAAIQSGRITALDAATGARRWEVGLPSRVDTAPTLYGGAVFVGCHDGRIHALSLADGRPIWRFTAAPLERRIVSGDRIESAWPVVGSVLVHDGALHAIAGHHTSIDGGLQMWGLDPGTGSVRYKRVFKGVQGPDAVILPTHWYKHEEVALNNVLFGGKVGEASIVRLYDEWGGWDFKASDGSLLRQHKAVPQPGWPKERVSPGEVTLDDRWPWVGHDRVTAANLLRGLPLTYANTLETDPRTRFSGAMGQMFLCPRQGATSILLTVKGGRTTVDPEPWIVPTDRKVYSEPKTFAEHAERKAADTWAPKPFPIEAAGAMITGEKVLWLAGKAYVEPSTNAPVAAPALSGTMVAVSIADGSQLGKWDFSGGVTFEGLSSADGRVYLAQDDGTVRCFGVKR